MGDAEISRGGLGAGRAGAGVAPVSLCFFFFFCLHLLAGPCLPFLSLTICPPFSLDETLHFPCPFLLWWLCFPRVPGQLCVWGKGMGLTHFFFFPFFFFFFFSGHSVAYGAPGLGIRSTYTAAVTMLAPLTCCAGLGIEPASW